jgi:hypothetical protein
MMTLEQHQIVWAIKNALTILAAAITQSWAKH